MSATISANIVFTGEIAVRTGGELDIVDITREVHGVVQGSGVSHGLAHLFVAGQTAALTTIEFEPGAVSDLRSAIERIAPQSIPYKHNATWGDGNGHSHVRAAFLGPDFTVPVRLSAPLLGTWQQIILVELDTRARDRRVHLTVLGSGSAEEVRS